MELTVWNKIEKADTDSADKMIYRMQNTNKCNKFFVKNVMTTPWTLRIYITIYKKNNDNVTIKV